ncbi:AI-2E family transporter [Aurantiacibacter sp. D1-12]|uniref:AI-2E family transporter n=1 Tax=Aurantiacibacter sp. D1-12 TaxID=2993658 RepID=UPI00237CA207|nr:AI-2E family transporter [Aurantiacibacter sp. D1-12]MDE1467163.1 AI-2E family transporter [Aurantiacibacter sp. D1-12]
MSSEGDFPEDESIGAARRRTMTFAAQELRLISALVVLLAIGLFFALPFVLSIGSVVFLPLVAGLILTIILSPLADKMASWGVPNILASLLALLAFFAILALALTAVFTPAISLYDEVPAMITQVGEHFSELQMTFAWVAQLNEQLAALTGDKGTEVVLAGPTMLEQLALATPTVLLELLLTFMLAFFMIEARVRMRRRLLLDRQQVGASLKAARAMREVQDRVAAYIMTVGVINLGVGVVVALGAWAMGMDAPIMWGGLAALLNFIPYVGPLMMIVLLGLFGLGSADSVFVGLIPAAAYLGLHTVESNVVTPSVLGARFTMNPVAILLALAYFGWIWGVAGALLSVPILLTLAALIDHLGRPNFIGFIFGEPLFSTNILDMQAED